MTDRKRSAHLYCNLFLVFFSTIVCVEAYRLRLGRVNNPGPGFFPFFGGIFVLLLSFVALLQSMKKGREANVEPINNQKVRWWNIAIILIAIIAFAFSLEKAGFLLNGFFFMLLLLKVVEPQTWKTAIMVAALTSIAANFLFNVIFGTQLPRGVLGF